MLEDRGYHGIAQKYLMPYDKLFKVDSKYFAVNNNEISEMQTINLQASMTNSLQKQEFS